MSAATGDGVRQRSISSARPNPTHDSRATASYSFTFASLNTLLEVQSAIMPVRPQSRPLPMPGVYSGECVRCARSVPKAVRSGLAAYFCAECWSLVEAPAQGGLDPAFESQRSSRRIEDD